MDQGQQPQGYGQAPQQQGYGPPPGWQGYAPAPAKKKSRWWVWLLFGAGAIVASCSGLFMVGAVMGAKEAGNAVALGEPLSTPAGVVAARQAEAPEITTVAIRELLSEYKDNEVRADAQFKGKRVRVSGKVDDIKKDILNNPYVTVGTGAQFEIPQVQCSLRGGEASAAAQLSKGADVTVTGKVGGLMMNVQLSDCEIE